VAVSGPTDLLLNFVLVAEGFQEGELPEFVRYAEQFADRLFATVPFNDARCGINIFRLDVVSNESGADDPAACGGPGTTAATYFDASYCGRGIRRLIVQDDGLVIEAVRQVVPAWHLILVLVNSQVWGGAGGQVANSCVAPGWEDIAIHEMGHSLFGLADEYPTLQGCASGETDHDNFPDVLGIRIEPAEPNITIFGSSGGKWADLIASGTLLPTTSNANCSVCDPQPSPVPAGTVGTFEGAGTYHCRVFRPEFDCKMRTTSTRFCAVCVRAIRQTTDAYHRIGVSWAPLRMVRINDYAGLNGFVGGFPNFHEADYGQGRVFGSVLLRPAAAEWRDVLASDLGNPSSFEQRFTAVNDYAVANGYVSGFPNFHEADYGQGTVYGCILVPAASADWQDVPAATLGNPGGIAPRFTAVNDYAVANGYVGGYPNFHEADYGQGTVYGCILLKPSAAEWRDVPTRDLCARPRRFNDAAFVTQGVPQFLRSSETRQVTVTMRNTGSSTWTRADAYRLGSQSPENNTVWGLGRVELPTPAVPPGASATFRFPITAPAVPGRYSFRWRMLREAVEWFGDFTPPTSIQIRPVAVASVAVAPLTDKRLELWAADGAGRLLSTWKITTNPDASWAPWFDFLAYRPGLPAGAQQIAMAPLSDGRLESWVATANGGLFSTWKLTTDPNADWASWFDFLAYRPGLPAGVQQVAMAPLSDGRLESWVVTTGGGLFTTWKLTTDPNADWAGWVDFQAEVGALPGGARQVAVAPLPDGRLEVWATTGTGQVFSTWKTTTDPNSAWAPWFDFLAYRGGLPAGVEKVAMAPLSDGRIESWAVTGGGGLFSTWKLTTDPNADWAGWVDFQAEVGALPGGARQVAVAPLSDRRLHLWSTTGTSGLLTTWKTTTDPNADWVPWSDFVAEV
jgi:hypothetical protein